MPRQKIGSLWKHKMKNGKLYLAGEIEIIRGIKQRIVLFKNDNKNKPNQPDYYIYLSQQKQENKKPKIEKIEENEI